MRSVLGLKSGDTFGSVLARHRGLGPGFDVLRIALAVAIFIGHAKWIGGGHSWGAAIAPAMVHVASAGSPDMPVYRATLTTPVKMIMVPAFFALSGFLVAGSAMRLRSTTTFLAHRALRIFPALMVEVLLTAFLLGPWLTTLPLREYFTHPQLLRYLGNAVGHVTMWLPGLFFEPRVTAATNANLWTLPAEFYCYLLIAMLMITGIMYRRTTVTLLVGIGLVAVAAAVMWHGVVAPTSTPHAVNVVVMYFLVGLLMYHWREYIPASPLLFFVAAAGTYACFLDPAWTYLAIPLTSYVAIAFGMIEFPRFRLLRSGDYSYGIYLFGFPITQALITVVPWFNARPWAFTVAAGLITALFAAASWHLVEKHALTLRHRLPERWFPVTPKERLTQAMQP